MPAKLLFLAGSIRTGSFNVRLARAACEAARQAGHEATFLDLSDYPMPLYNGDLEKAEGVPQKARQLGEVFKAHQGVFIASPEYNAGVTPLLKNTIDWLSRIREEGGLAYPALSGQVYAIGAASPGGFGGVRGLLMLRQTLAVGLGLLVLGEQVVVPRAGEAFDEDGALQDARAAGALRRTVERLSTVAAQLGTSNG